MPMIRANRESIDDRFSVLGFTVRTESPLFEVGLATDPELFRAGAPRTRRNFYSSRVHGALRARRGEAVYLVPPDVLANFVGQQRLYFGLVTYREGATAQPEAVVAPSSGNMYINLSGLTERGLRRLAAGGMASSSYGSNGQDASLQWGGDAAPSVAPPMMKPNGNGANGSAAAMRPSPATYDDGFGEFGANAESSEFRRATANDVKSPAQQNPAAPAPSAPAATAQSYRGAARVVSAEDDQDVLSMRRPLVRAQEIITPFYDPADPNSALTCQNDAFSQAREEWFVGVSNTRSFPHSAICQLKVTAPDGKRYQGTGFYIGRNRILTCAHNLSGMSSCTIIPGRNGGGSDNAAQPFGQVTVNSSSWRVAPGYSGDGDYPNDLAVIDNVPLAAPSGKYFRFLNATRSTRMRIVVCGYSAASDAVPALTAAIDRDKQHLHGGYATRQSDPETIDYAILTLKGASGSPVYHIDDGSGQLQALITAVHVSGAPAAQGANRGCFITPSKIDWIEGRTTSFAARALANECFSTHWDTTPHYPQTSPMSCWAAAAAMVVGWRDQRRVTDTEIAAKVPVFEAYKNGLFPSERRQLADAWNLVPEAAASYTIDAWHDMLRSYGPLYIDMTWDTSGGGHARVLMGMTSDGAPDGSDTVMYLHDPWPQSPGRIKLSFADFLALYEGRTQNSGGQLQYQILRSASMPAQTQPTIAAPFSLATADDRGEVMVPHRSSEEAPRFALAPAPEPIVQQLQRSRALTVPAAAVEIASVVAGASMERIANNAGDITWELDQLRGFKHPNDTAPSPLPPAQDGTVIRLNDWPRVSDSYIDDIFAGFEINWQHNGKSVGNVLISNIATNDAVGWGLTVKAKIMDDNIVYPRDNPTFAALRLRFEYRFTHVLVRDQIAVVDVHLFGNGKYNLQSRWEQTGMM